MLTPEEVEKFLDDHDIEWYEYEDGDLVIPEYGITIDTKRNIFEQMLHLVKKM